MIGEKALSALAACAVALCGVAIAAPGIAKERRPIVVTGPSKDELPTRRVSYRDLNLATSYGERTLHRRVGYAVKDVCIESVGGSATFHEASRCRIFAWGGARPQIARAVQRAREIAQFGTSSIPAVAISISFPAQ
jgi:UrcA family protein